LEDDLMLGPSIQPSDEAQAAGVVLEGWVV
jgi:hypothetical protein